MLNESVRKRFLDAYKQHVLKNEVCYFPVEKLKNAGKKDLQKLARENP